MERETPSQRDDKNNTTLRRQAYVYAYVYEGLTLWRNMGRFRR